MISESFFHRKKKVTCQLWCLQWKRGAVFLGNDWPSFFFFCFCIFLPFTLMNYVLRECQRSLLKPEWELMIWWFFFQKNKWFLLLPFISTQLSMVHIVTIYLFLSHPNITFVSIESFLDIDVRKKKVLLKNFNHMFIAIKLCLL